MLYPPKKKASSRRIVEEYEDFEPLEEVERGYEEWYEEEEWMGDDWDEEWEDDWEGEDDWDESWDDDEY